MRLRVVDLPPASSCVPGHSVNKQTDETRRVRPGMCRPPYYLLLTTWSEAIRRGFFKVESLRFRGVLKGRLNQSGPRVLLRLSGRPRSARARTNGVDEDSV
jgi:hypothetical protein